MWQRFCHFKEVQYMISGSILYVNCMLVIRIYKIIILLEYSRSGIDEDYGEKEILLEEIISLLEDEENQKEKDKQKKEIEENRGIRKRALENITPKKGKYFFIVINLSLNFILILYSIDYIDIWKWVLL